MKMNKKMKTTMSLAAAMGTFALATSAQAAVIQPIDARESTAFSGRPATDATNGVGLDDPTSVETGDPVPVTWTLHNNLGADQWLSDGSTISDQWVMFDLGAAYQTDSMFFWNTFLGSDVTTGRGISDMDVSFATSLDTSFATATTGDSNWGNTVNLTPALGVVVASKGAGELLTYTSVSARYVLFEVTDNHPNGDQFVGMSEVRFIEAVPEPSTTALLGLGGLALILRRRK
jgi:hypothetical protein